MATHFSVLVFSSFKVSEQSSFQFKTKKRQHSRSHPLERFFFILLHILTSCNLFGCLLPSGKILLSINCHATKAPWVAQSLPRDWHYLWYIYIYIFLYMYTIIIIWYTIKLFFRYISLHSIPHFRGSIRRGTPQRHLELHGLCPRIYIIFWIFCCPVQLRQSYVC